MHQRHPAGQVAPHMQARVAPAHGRLCCPRRGSDALSVYDTERHVCAVASEPGAPPRPSYTRDETLETDPDSYVCACDACLAANISPRAHTGGPAMSGRDVDRDARDLARAVGDAADHMAAAAAALERARQVAASYHWAAMAITCGTARRRLAALTRQLTTEGVSR